MTDDMGSFRIDLEIENPALEVGRPAKEIDTANRQ